MKHHCLSLILLLLVLTSSFHPTLADAVITVDSTGRTGRFTSIAIAPSGFPVISYFDETNLDLKLAVCNDSLCSTPTLQTVDNAPSVGWYTDIAIAPSGFPVISYQDDNNGDLKLAICNDSLCSVPTLRIIDSAGIVGWDTSITIAPSGFPVISYYDDSNSALKLAVCNDSTCSVPTLTTVDNTGTVGEFTSIAITPSGFPMISYLDRTNFDLKLALCNDNLCSAPTLQTLDSAGNVGRFTSVAIASSGFPAVTYYDDVNDDLKLAVCQNSLCSTATLRIVDSNGDVGWYSAVAIAPNGDFLISYRDTTNTDLKLAVCNNIGCTPRTIDAVEDVGWDNALAFLPDGTPVVSYYDLGNADLKMAVLENFSPTLTPLASQTVRAGDTLTFNLTANDLDNAPVQQLTYSMNGAGLSGATLDATTGAFAWTPTDAQIGSHLIHFTVTDNGVPAKSDTETVLMTVESGNDAPTLAFIGSQNVLIGETISFNVTATDPDAGQTLTYTVSGDVPTGATFTNGQFNWTSNAVGIYNLTFTVTDNGVPTLSDSQTVSLLVRAPTNTPPQFTDQTDYVGVTGDNITLNLSAIDVDPDQVVTYNILGSLPAGAALDTATGAFSWTAPPAGVYSLTFTATDNGVPALSATETVQFAINDQLVLNGGFEDAGAKPKFGNGWTGAGLSKDKRLCTGIGANGSLCAFRFKGSATENSKLKQTLSISWLDIGDTVTLSALFKPTSVPENSRVARLKVVYLDGTKAVKTIRLGGTSDLYIPAAAEPLIIERDVRKLQVFIEYRGASGSFLVDEAQVTVTSANTDPTRR